MRDVPPAGHADARASRSRRGVRPPRRRLGRRFVERQSAAPSRAARPRDARRAGLPDPPAVRRAAPGRARRRADRSGGARVGRRGRSGPPRDDARGRIWRRWRGPRSSTATTALSRFILQPFQPVQPMLAESAADVGEALADSRRGVVRIQARWRAHPGAQGRRRGEGLLAEPARRHGRGAGSRDGRARDAGARDRPRRRGDRAARRRHAASLPDHDAAVRPQARCRRA